MPERYRLVLKDTDVNLSKMSYNEREELAETTEDVKVLRKLAKDKNRAIRGEVASNKNTSLDILRKLSKDEDNYVCNKVKSNPTFKKYVKSLNLNKLDEIDYMCSEDVIKLAKTTDDVDILRKLSEYKDTYGLIRELVAENKNCPVDILRKLADNEYSTVRKIVAKNKKCPLDILKKLSEDEDDDVSKVARRELNYKSNKNNLKTISLDDIKIGRCITLNESEVQQAYYFIFHTLIPVEVKNEKFVLTTSWSTGDREDVYNNMDEYGENIPWNKLLNEAKCSDSWRLIYKSVKSYIDEGNLDSCLETMFKGYSISDKDFNTVKNEILRKNKLGSIEGYSDGGLLGYTFKDSKFRDSNSELWYVEELRNIGLNDKEIKILELEGMFRPSDEPYDINYRELIANIRYSAEEHLRNYLELIEGLSDEEFTGPSNKIKELANIIKKIVKSRR